MSVEVANELRAAARAVGAGLAASVRAEAVLAIAEHIEACGTAQVLADGWIDRADRFAKAALDRANLTRWMPAAAEVSREYAAEAEMWRRVSTALGRAMWGGP